MVNQTYLPKWKRISESGRPKDVVKGKAFLQVLFYFENNDDKQVTINDLIGKMAEVIKDDWIDPYIFPAHEEGTEKAF